MRISIKRRLILVKENNKQKDLHFKKYSFFVIFKFGKSDNMEVKNSFISFFNYLMIFNSLF